jgi:hypothetical protein
MKNLTTEFDGRKMSVIAAVKRAYVFQGWRFVEVVGRLRSDALPGATFSSRKARTIIASARSDGRLSKKVYSQKEAFYLTVSMHCPFGEHGEDGNIFVLVFSKRRAPNQHIQPTRR